MLSWIWNKVMQLKTIVILNPPKCVNSTYKPVMVIITFILYEIKKIIDSLHRLIDLSCHCVNLKIWLPPGCFRLVRCFSQWRLANKPLAKRNAGDGGVSSLLTDINPFLISLHYTSCRMQILFQTLKCFYNLFYYYIFNGTVVIVTYMRRGKYT